MKKISHVIGGKSVEVRGGRTAPVFNPATGAQTAEVQLASAEEVDAAVAAARAAFPAWAATPPLRRARLMNRLRDLIETHADELAAIISAEHGKVISDARGEVTRGLEVVEFACGAPQLLKGEITENIGVGIDSHAVRQPIGVAAGITPFNFPAGKLKGVMPAATPIGCRTAWLSIPTPMFSVISPFRSCGAPQANSTTSRPRVTSPRASEMTLPCSALMIAASSSAWVSMRSRSRFMSRARRSGGVAAQAGNAARAAATAASTSSALASWTSAVWAPVAGLNTGAVRPPRTSTDFPPMT